MGDELKALLEAVTKLQPLLVDSLNFPELRLLREQVERIAASAAVQSAPNTHAAEEQGNDAAGLGRARPISRTRRSGETFEDSTSVQPNPNSILKGEKVEGEASLREAQPFATEGSTGEHVMHIASSSRAQAVCDTRPAKEHVEQIASLAGPSTVSDIRFISSYGEGPSSNESPASTARLPWDQVGRIASLVGQHSICNSRASWDHTERVSSMAASQPVCSTGGTVNAVVAVKGVTVTADRICDGHSRPKTQAVDEKPQEFGPSADPSIGRIYKTGKWTPAEILTLVNCKRSHFMKYRAASNRRNLRTSAAERWSEMEEEMFRRNVMRSKSQCQEKWEQLASDFKKVYDHQQNHVPLGEPSYFQMTSAERKEHMQRFPKAALDEGVYNVLRAWYPRSSQLPDPGEVPTDSSLDVAATRRGGNPVPDVTALGESRLTHDDGIGDSSSPNPTKRRRISTKASEGAFSAVENDQKENVNVSSLFVGQDREDARHRLLLEMDAKKHREILELKARKHQDKIIIEKERLQRSAALGQGYIAAMLSIADALKAIGEALRKS